ncbi:MAG: outer membrane protein assembly factor BamD [Alphaproteobacteria bacterium]|nr:outer membrane protein assembly factor BamD [Alphaproteobacteria bacterium]
MASNGELTRGRGAACALALLVALAGCAGAPDPYRERPVEELYNRAMDQLFDGQNQIAAKGFEEVERQHPYSVWSRKAQLMAAYSNYLANRYDEAILAAERYIQLYPGSRDASYALYLVAISHYEQIVDVGRDQRVTRQALTALQQVVDRFPDSDYARDARLKIDLTRDHLAGKEMEIGRYYLKRKEYAAAINRFRAVVEQFQTTSHVPEALHRLTEAYLALGVNDEARTAAAVLGHNFPGSEWYIDSYALLTGQNLAPAEAQGSWLSRLWRSVL